MYKIDTHYLYIYVQNRYTLPQIYMYKIDTHYLNIHVQNRYTLPQIYMTAHLSSLVHITQIYMTAHFPGTRTSIKCIELKLVSLAQTSLPIKIMWSFKCFQHASKMPILT